MMRVWMRRWGPWVLLIAAATALSILLATDRDSEPLSPHNPGVEGAQALAQVLANHGVDVQIVYGTRAVQDMQIGPESTVLIPHTDYLGAESGAALLAQVRDSHRVVVLVDAPQEHLSEVLGIPVQSSWRAGAPVAAECTDELIREGDRVTDRQVLFSVNGPERASATVCYPPSPGHNLGGAREGALVTVPAEAGRPQLTLIGFPMAWTNSAIAQEANAALALRALGGAPRLIWVIPQPTDLSVNESPGLWEVLPRNLSASMVLLAVSVLALAWWRGRRLGPLVTEPLPTVVPATETTRSRGRLYRQAKDRPHALAALQAGARARLAPRLGLPRTVEPAVLVEAVSVATDRPLGEVERLLTSTEVSDDQSLITTARAVRSLEEGLHP